MITTDTHVFFFSQEEIYSNFYPCTFTENISKFSFSNTEQAFMFYKAVFFNDIESKKKISLEDNPYKVKLLGRSVENFDPVAWGCVSYGFMVYVNYLKFSQNPELKDALLSTGNKTLVEASVSDRIWGIGLRIDNPDIYEENKWQGTNLLGKALMEVRSKLL